MPPLPVRLRRIAAAQDGLFTRIQAREAGVTDNALQHRTGRSIQWVLPAVYSASTGALSAQQRLRAAVLYGRVGGAHDVAILGGLAAAAMHGLKAAGQPDVILLLLPRNRRLAPVSFVAVRRTGRLGPVSRRVGLPVCAPARSVVDAARGMRNHNDVRALVAECVQKRKATPDAIAAELRSGGSSGSQVTRAVLAEVADGAHSVAEAQLRALMLKHGLPPAIWNRDVYADDGAWLARPDARWEEALLIVEVESREWHLAPADWEATMRRTNRLSRLGYTVQQVTPRRIKHEPRTVIAEIRAAYAAGYARRHPVRH